MAAWSFCKIAQRAHIVSIFLLRAGLKAQINKTDRNDARGIAQMMRVGLYRPVHVEETRPPPSGGMMSLAGRWMR